MRFIVLLSLFSVVLLQPTSAQAQAQSNTTQKTEEKSEVRLYTTNAERREIGIKHQIFPWLAASGLLELEGLMEGFKVRGNNNGNTIKEGAATLQLGLIATPWDSAKGELILDFDTVTQELFADEAFVGFEVGPWEIEAGKVYTPFGTYISHFATGPLVEFGETRATSVTLSYGPDVWLDFLFSAYQGNARKLETDSGRWDGAFAVEFWLRESVSLGLSYQTNLADADSRLLSDQNDRYVRKVPGASGYLVWSSPLFEVSIEALGALRSFREMEPDRDLPIAWNLEFVHFVLHNLEWALRLEGSQDLEDAPELQFGVAVTWRTWKYSSLTLEYLRGHFKGELATNDNDEPYNHVDRFGMQFSILF